MAPPRPGWYATYTVHAPAAGPYRLRAVVMPPATADSDKLGGSFFRAAVGDGPFEQVAKADPVWAAMPRAWGGLVLRIGKPSKPLRLRPSITRISATARALRATIRDELSGVDPSRIRAVRAAGRQ